MTPDQCIEEIWRIAQRNPDHCCEPQISAHHDMWWGVFIQCSHGQVAGHSEGMTDISVAFTDALAMFRYSHLGELPASQS